MFRIPETKNEFAAPKIRTTVLETIKMSSSFESFKSKTRQWKPECLCPVFDICISYFC